MVNNDVKYSEIKVWSSPLAHDVYICRGALVDFLFLNGVKPKEIDDNIVENRLLYDREYDKLKGGFLENVQSPGHLTFVYRFIFRDTDYSSWFMSYDEAVNSPAAMKHDKQTREDYINRNAINFKVYDPINPVNIPCIMTRTEDGRYMTKLAIHPETHGNINKPFFPDKSWTDVDIGPAIVSVRREMDKYGFIVGKMVQFQLPTDQLAFLGWLNIAYTRTTDLDYLRINDDNIYADSHIHTVSHPTRGEFYAISGTINFGCMQCAQAKKYGIIQETITHTPEGDRAEYSLICQSTDTFQYADYITESYRIDDYIGKCAYGTVEEYHRLTKLMLDADKQCAFTNTAKYELSTGWVQDNESTYPDLIEDAIANELLKPLIIPGYKIAVLALRNISEMGVFDSEEIEEIAKYVHDLNRKAEDTIQSKSRAGKLKVTIRSYGYR